jgi:hypothetical protein
MDRPKDAVTWPTLTDLDRKSLDVNAMRWFRDNLRQGSWLALLALVVNLSLSFGHVHAADGKVVSAGLLAEIAAVAGQDDGSRPSHPVDGHADLLCPICAASSAIAAGLISAPPVLPVEFSVAVVGRNAAPDPVRIDPPRAGFQSRGPPLS